MDVANSDTLHVPNSEMTDYVTLTNTIQTILGIVKETMKRVKQIERQVRDSSKEVTKHLTPSSGVVKCMADSWSWVPTSVSKFSETIDCCSQSSQSCPTEIEDNHKYTPLLQVHESNAPEAKHRIGDVGFTHFYRPEGFF